MRKCGKCKKKYPDKLVNLFVTMDSKLMLCPICALAETNRIHGTNRTEFDGENANIFLREAKEFDKKRG